MLNLLVLLCFVGGTIASGVQLAWMRKGWVNKKFKDDPAKFRTNKLKEFMILAVSGLVCGALFIGIGFLEERRPAQIERFVIGGVLMVCGAAVYWMRTLLPKP